MKNIFWIALIVFQSLKIQAQDFQLGKVTKAELEQLKHPSDTSASAAILFKKVKTNFKYFNDKGFVCYTDFSIKLKIYKTEGLKWANFELPYYVGYKTLEDESISITDAYTYNLENGKIKREKVTGEGKFQEEVNEFWKTKLITFPNVKVGSIIEFKYTLKSQNLSVLPDFQFQYKIPVNFVEYVTEIPEYYIYKGVKSGFLDINMEQAWENTSQRYQDEFRHSQDLYYRQLKTKYTAYYVPALISESYVNNINNYYGMIGHELQTIRMPNEKPKELIKTWEDVAKSIYNDKEFGKELEKFNYFIDDIKPLLTGLNTNQEKTIKIFEFVKKRMIWNGKYGYNTKDGVEIAYKEKVGNAAEINLILTAMLKMAGIEAAPVLISTRENGVALFPNRSRFNYVIASAKIDNKDMLLDATNKFATLNRLPIRDLNWVGRLIQKDGRSIEIDLMPKTISNKTINVIANINTNGAVEGKVKLQYDDYNAFVFRNKYAGLSKESYLEKLEKRYGNIEIGEYEVANTYDLDKPLTEMYSFKNENSVEIIGDKMYLSPLLFFTENENPFKQEKREYPIDFDFPNQDKYQITINIPEGYTVESFPASGTVTMVNNLAGFKFDTSATTKQIQISVVFDISTSIIFAQYYQDLKTFFSEMIKKQNEKIVLKKT